MKPTDVVMALASKVIVGLLATAILWALSYAIALIARQSRVKDRNQRQDTFERRHFWGVELSPLGLSISSALAIAVGVGAYLWTRSDFSNKIPLVAGLVGLALALMIADRLREFYTISWMQQDNISEMVYETLDKLARSVQERIADAEIHIPAGGCVRCNVMEYDHSSHLLVITHRRFMNDKADIDRDVRLTPGQGVAGYAWSHSEPAYGDVGELRQTTMNAEMPDKWCFTKSDWEKIRKDLKWIWSCPLRWHNERPSGVLNVDSNIPLSGELTSSIGQMIQDYAIFLSIVQAQEVYNKVELLRSP